MHEQAINLMIQKTEKSYLGKTTTNWPGFCTARLTETPCLTSSWGETMVVSLGSQIFLFLQKVGTSCFMAV